MKKIAWGICKAITLLLLFLVLFLVVSYSLASYYRRDILGYFNEKINEGINGTAQIADLDFTVLHPFPSLSVSLEGFSILDSLYQKEVIVSERVFLQINVWKLLKKEVDVKSIIIQNASFTIFKDSAGYSNLSVFKAKSPAKDTLKKTSTTLMDFDLKRIVLRNVTFLYQDEKKRKTIHLYLQKVFVSCSKKDTTNDFRLKGIVYSNGLLFNETKGAFLEKKSFHLDLHLSYLSHKHTLVLFPSSIISEEQEYKVQGRSVIERKPFLIDLDIRTEDTDYNKAISLLSSHLQKVLHKFHVAKGLSSQTKLLLSTQPGAPPIVSVHFQLNDSKLRVLNQDLAHVYLAGSFSNQSDSLLPPNDDNSEVKVKNANFNYQGLQCVVDCNVHDMNKLNLKANASIKALLKNLNQHIDTTKYILEEGALSAHFTYIGPLAPRKKTVHELDAKIKGQLAIQDARFQVIDKHLSLAAWQGKMLFNESDLQIPSLKGTLNGNQVVVSGNCKQLIPFLMFPDKDMKAILRLTSPHFNVNKLLIKGKPNKEKSKPKLGPAMEHLHHIAERIDIGLDVDLDKLEYKKLITEKVKGKVHLNKEALRLENWKVKLPMHGEASLNGSYFFADHEYGKAKLDAKLTNINAPMLFRSFSNFYQKTLQDHNLEGTLHARVYFNCLVDEDYDPIRHSIHGDLSLLLSKGELKDFEPLQRISKVVFKNRDLMHIRFDEISNVFLLRGDELHIQKMSVNSTALSLYVEGIYSFKDKTDLSIQIPLANLKAKKEEFYESNDDNHGNIRLRAREKDGKVAVSLDLFDRYHHQKKE